MMTEKLSDARLAELDPWALAPNDAQALIAELQERRAVDAEPPTSWRITIPGYEYNPNGADYYPDDFTDFEGTEEELRAYILTRETRYQAARLLHTRSPHHYTGKGDLSLDVWHAIDLGEGEGVCAEWCRGVVQVVVQPRIEVFDIVRAAKEAAKSRVEEIIAAAEAKVEAKKVGETAKAADAERRLYEQLAQKYGKKETT